MVATGKGIRPASFLYEAGLDPVLPSGARVTSIASITNTLHKKRAGHTRSCRSKRPYQQQKGSNFSSKKCNSGQKLLNIRIITEGGRGGKDNLPSTAPNAQQEPQAD
jgi:hypothetical protein